MLDRPCRRHQPEYAHGQEQSTGIMWLGGFTRGLVELPKHRQISETGRNNIYANDSKRQPETRKNKVKIGRKNEHARSDLWTNACCCNNSSHKQILQLLLQQFIPQTNLAAAAASTYPTNTHGQQLLSQRVPRTHLASCSCCCCTTPRSIRTLSARTCSSVGDSVGCVRRGGPADLASASSSLPIPHQAALLRAGAEAAAPTSPPADAQWVPAGCAVSSAGPDTGRTLACAGPRSVASTPLMRDCWSPTCCASHASWSCESRWRAQPTRCCASGSPADLAAVDGHVGWPKNAPGVASDVALCVPVCVLPDACVASAAVLTCRA
eukprot:363740-Chlamydomonas_euryale.AAC.34